MIQLQTTVKIADNTGAKIVQCIGIPGGTRKRYVQLGEIFVGAVKKAEPRKPVKKHDIVKAVVIRQRRKYRRKDGSYISFDDNAAVILADDKGPRGGRVLGPMAKEIREKGFDRVAALAKDLV